MNAIKKTGQSMGILTLFILFFEKISDIYVSELPSCNKEAQRFVMLFIIGLMFYLFSTVYYKNFSIMDNESIRNGVKYGGLVLTAKITINYWTQMNDQLKLMVISIIFGWLLYFSQHTDTIIITDNNNDNNVNK